MESSHDGFDGNNDGLQDEYYLKFFTKLNFPVTKETDAWKEKVSSFFDFQLVSYHSAIISK